MLIMIMEIHKKLMEGEKSMIEEYTRELQERLLSQNKSQEPKLMEEEILVEN